MAKNNDAAQNKNCIEGQPDHESENDHADTNGPDRLQPYEAIMNIKAENKIENDDLYKYQPQPPCDQELTQLFLIFSQLLKIPRSACKKNKRRRANVRDPPCKI